MRPLHRLIVAAVVLAVVTGGCSDKTDKGATAVTPTLTTLAASTTATTMPTSSAPAAAPTTPAPPTTAAPTTSATPTTAAPPSTIKAPAGQTRPALAATGLIDAWHADDRAGAATYADPPAVQVMFTIAREPVQAAGPCQQDGAAFSCAYFTKSGNAFYLRSAGSRATGYRIAEVTTSSD